MLRIRLRRVGKRGKPSYRIVVADVRAPRDGAYLEWIGNYDPMADPPSVVIKRERAEEWLSKGAQPSDAVKRILQWQGILEREPVNRNAQSRNAEVLRCSRCSNYSRDANRHAGRLRCTRGFARGC
ncbi:MAG: 30S ribosomal protein S16 [Chloroflexi bacterium]|nr:30S ribosomal protein S16 [Chloroflexota bacterium]